MKILLLGSGAREHALARALARDPQTSELIVAPGNPGTSAIATNLNIDPSVPEEVVALATQMKADLVVVGPEAPLVAGVADAVRDAGIPCFGPGAEAARLEGSKAFAKEVMAAAGVPTAEAAVCSTFAEFDAALDRFGAPHVVKDDGLAAGKGVVVTSDRNEALALTALFDGHTMPPVTSTKSMTGHEMWMAGASEVVYSLLMMRGQFIAPHLNFEHPDDDTAPLRIPTERLDDYAFDTFLSNSFGFGGTNSTLIIGRVRE